MNAQRFNLAEMAERARVSIRQFAELGCCYVGVSWGKDSTVLAHLAAEIGGLSLVWVRVRRVFNPDCLLVRDAFISQYGDQCSYDEIEVDCPIDSDGSRSGHGALDAGFAEAARKYGDRYVSGVRGEESRVRKIRMRKHGVSTLRTCAPIGWWSADHVYAYLYLHSLPVHPAYACTMGGTLDRDWLRVATLGGERGTEFGRADWERQYYPAEIGALSAAGLVK
ncbi:MAG: hypothetical protein NVS3B20_08740 [Polyangiales bacterium]